MPTSNIATGHDELRGSVGAVETSGSSQAGYDDAWFRTAAAIFFVFLWGSAFVPSKIGVLASSPLWFLVVRFAVSGALALAIALALGRAVAARRGALGLLIAAARRPRERDLPRLQLRGAAASRRRRRRGRDAARTRWCWRWSRRSLLGEPLTRWKAVGSVLGFAGVVAIMLARSGTGTAQPRDVALALLARARQRREHDRVQEVSGRARRAHDDRAAALGRGVGGAAVRDRARGRAARDLGRAARRRRSSIWSR